MDTPLEWALTAVVVLAAVTLLVLGRRTRRTPAEPMAQLAKGERPVVILHTQDLDYDLTDTGVRLADDAYGNAVWQYTAPLRLLPFEDADAEVTVPVMPPRTTLGVRFHDQD